MALNPKVPTAIMDAMLDVIGGDAAGGSIVIYNGTQPANGGDPLTGQVALVTFVLPSPAFGAASGKVLTANTIANVNASSSGTPTWFRMYESDGVTPILDGSAGLGSGFDCQLANDVIVIGQPQGIVACTITGNN